MAHGRRKAATASVLFAAILAAFPGRAAAQVDPITLGAVAVGVASLAVAGAVKLGELAADQLRAQAADARRDEQIGIQSSPTVVPAIGDLRLLVLPLNTANRQGQTPFVVCVVPRWTGGERRLWPRTAAFDPKAILLNLPDGTALRPSGYAVQRCPYPEFVGAAEVPFQELDFDAPLVVKREVPGGQFPVFAVRFDSATLAPDQPFSLELGALVLDAKRRHELPRIEFAPHYGQIKER